MGCQNSNQIAPMPKQIPLTLNQHPPSSKKIQHRITPQNILTGKSKQITGDPPSFSKLKESKSNVVLQAIDNIESNKSKKESSDKLLTEPSQTNYNRIGQVDSANPSSTQQSQARQRNIKKGRNKRRHLDPFEKELKRLYGL